MHRRKRTRLCRIAQSRACAMRLVQCHRICRCTSASASDNEQICLCLPIWRREARGTAVLLHGAAWQAERGQITMNKSGRHDSLAARVAISTAIERVAPST